MDIKVNFDDLKMLHDKARISKVGSKDWIEFAVTMIDNFPLLYETAKRMNSKYNNMRDQVETGKHIIQSGIEIMNVKQVSKWYGVRSYLESETDKHL